MELKDQVITLEQAKLLKELGVNHQPMFWWIEKAAMSYGYEGEWSVEENEFGEPFLFDHAVCFGFFDGEPQTYDVALRPKIEIVVNSESSDEELDEYEKQSKEGVIRMRSHIYPAYTVAELGEMLIVGDDTHFCFSIYDDHGGNWSGRIEKRNEEAEDGFMLFFEAEAETEAEARGAILIYLIENKLITI